MTWANLPTTVAEAADFLKHVYIENLDYQDCIKKWDCQECLFYMDPPYEGVEKNFYHPNKKDGFDHKAMADFVKTIQGSCVISYYDSELIRSYYPENEGFQHFTKNVVKNMQTSEKKDSAVELLIVKKSLFAKQKDSQLSCFEE
jgi:DNA adenine methylase